MSLLTLYAKAALQMPLLPSGICTDFVFFDDVWRCFFSVFETGPHPKTLPVQLAVSLTFVPCTVELNIVPNSGIVHAVKVLV